MYSRGDAEVPTGARCRDRVVWSHESNVHGQHRPAHVVDREGDAERVHLAEACRKCVGGSDYDIVMIAEVNTWAHANC